MQENPSQFALSVCVCVHACVRACVCVHVSVFVCVCMLFYGLGGGFVIVLVPIDLYSWLNTIKFNASKTIRG